MRATWLGLLLSISTASALRCEIHDVLKKADIDAAFAKGQASLIIHHRPNFTISLHTSERAAPSPERHDSADEVIFIWRGSGSLWLDSRRLEIGAGDLINVKRKTAHQIDAPSGRMEYIAVRISPEAEGAPVNGIRPAAGVMPDVLRASQIDETFRRFDTNQPIHIAPNFTLNYVIYQHRVGPWESHHGCADIYFIKTGTAVAGIGGVIDNPKEVSPGEIRGTGLTGARHRELAPGDLVLIPRDAPHHMDPGAGKLGYVLLKIWAP